MVPLLWLFSLVGAVNFELLPYNPVAAPAAVIVSGNARFSVLTDRIIRLEYSANASFVDEPTLAFVNRKLPVPSFSSKIDGSTLRITTASLSLSYLINQPFSASSLSITVAGAAVPVYHFGDVDNGNLLGTIRSLDELGVTPLNCTLNANITVHQEGLHCQWGLISRNGWTTVDDSDNYIMDPATNWWTGPNPNIVDTYFFGHGTDFVGALTEYSLLGGAVAMPPRAANGVFWSRWYNMNDQDVNALVDDYESRGLPLDCYILDMDWHTKEGWGGYSFDKSLFPIPAAVMAPLRNRGVLTSGNLHDNDGVRPNEDAYVPFCNAIGVNPALNQTIAFDLVNMTYALALEDQVLKPLEDQSFGDFWWIDWQQGGTQGGCAGGKANPTILLNKLRATDKIRRGQTQRGMILARWGGLGNHRYQVGFSGDVQDVTWANLAYQPYFSLTASNVLFGQWSHDIVGPSDDLELYTRWVQWGAVSSVMRSHDRGMASGSCSQNNPPNCAIVKVWDVPTPYFEANREALQFRHRLLPYMYNAQRIMFETGVSLMRPLYYSWPNEPNAYLADENGNFPQYMLGPDIMFAPVVSPGFQNDTLARQSVWIPPGEWIEGISGEVISASTGGLMWNRAYDLSETPYFVRAGAVIPMLPLQVGNTIGRALQQYTELDILLTLPPGVSSGSTTLYEDDGISTAYVTGLAYCKTMIGFSRTDNNITVTVGKCSEGKGYPDFPAQRSYTFRYIGAPPTTVVVNGQPTDWTFDGVKMHVVITTPPLATNAGVVVTIIVSDPSLEGALFGMEGQIRRANLAKQALDPNWSTPGAQTVETAKLSTASSSGVALSFLALNDPYSFSSKVLSFSALYVAAISEVLGIEPNAPFPNNALVQWWSESRQDSCLCSHTECNDLQSSAGYKFMRIEGFVPASGTPGTVPLNDFWSAAIDDNLATTSSSAAAGYSPAIFANGVVFSNAAKPESGAVALQTWWSEERQDWLTVASAAGVAYAKANGYTLGNASIGYAYSSQPLTQSEKDSVTPPTVAQWNRAIALLKL